MGMKASGKVYKVSHFPANGRWGESWSIKLDGNDVYFKTTADPSRIAISGAYVEIEHEDINRNGKYPTAKIVGLKAVEAATAPTAAPVSSSYADRQPVISLQACRNAAIEMAKFVVQAGALKLPAKETNKLEVLEALVDTYTVAFLNDNEDLGAALRKRTAGEEEEDNRVEPEGDEE